MNPETTQWLIYIGLAVGGYFLRNVFPNLHLPAQPQTQPIPTQLTPILPVSVLDNPKALELLRELLHAQPPAAPPSALQQR